RRGPPCPATLSDLIKGGKSLTGVPSYFFGFKVNFRCSQIDNQ
ncbi:mCG1048941, partial [Mus musculus]